MEAKCRCALRSGAGSPAFDLCKLGGNMACRFEKVNVTPTVPRGTSVQSPSKAPFHSLPGLQTSFSNCCSSFISWSFPTCAGSS